MDLSICELRVGIHTIGTRAQHDMLLHDCAMELLAQWNCKESCNGGWTQTGCCKVEEDRHSHYNDDRAMMPVRGQIAEVHRCWCACRRLESFREGVEAAL